MSLLGYGIAQAAPFDGKAEEYKPSETFLALQRKAIEAERLQHEHNFHQEIWKVRNEASMALDFLCKEIDALKARIAELEAPKQGNTPNHHPA